MVHAAVDRFDGDRELESLRQVHVLHCKIQPDLPLRIGPLHLNSGKVLLVLYLTVSLVIQGTSTHRIVLELFGGSVEAVPF